MGKDEREDVWKDVLGGLGVDSGPGPYEKISDDEIEKAGEHNPQRADLMRAANNILDSARERSEGEVIREPEFHETGWNILFETDGGLVGLWSCWLGNKFYIGYPADLIISAEIIKRTLNVKDASPVKYIGAVAVNDWGYKGEYKDKDKPLEQNEAGQIVAYQDNGERLWSQYYGPIENNDGRVWVCQENNYGEAVRFRYLSNHGLQVAKMDHSNCMSISTFPYSFHNKYSYEGPTTDCEAIQSYREKFIRLAAEVAYKCGRLKAIHIDYGFALVPEDLQREGYSNIEWKKGSWGRRNGWGDELVIAEKGENCVAIVSGNSLVPWITVVRYPVKNESAEQLANRIAKSLLTV